MDVHRDRGGGMEIRTDRVGVLIDQLSSSKEFSQQRLDGLVDDEYLWEPVEGMWSVRRREEARTSDAYGPGLYVLDFEATDPLAPGPATTIAWRLGHLISAFAGRWEWTFGDRRTPPKNVVEFTPHAEKAVAQLWEWVPRWIDGIEHLTSDQLETPGFGQYPQGLDPEIPFIGIVWWMNREFIHHLAEVALLRDLYGSWASPQSTP
jgi:hypothetical protein